ncbi:hypothetical protein [Terasakiella pusilla]|uniref:hypothetical protein n=1 Tax=Terasakiella pusilla TaxID=64973 RepID=UPI003AA8041A
MDNLENSSEAVNDNNEDACATEAIVDDNVISPEKEKYFKSYLPLKNFIQEAESLQASLQLTMRTLISNHQKERWSRPYKVESTFC